MGMALTPCITPASGEPSFELAEDEVEIGIGIHGEPGRFREKIGSGLAGRRAADDPDPRGPAVRARATGCWRSSTGWAARRCWSSTWSTPRWRRSPQEHGLTIERNLIGNYITSLEMQGCSITLLKLDDELVRYWDAPVEHAGAALGSLVQRWRSTATPRRAG